MFNPDEMEHVELKWERKHCRQEDKEHKIVLYRVGNNERVNLIDFD